MKLLIRLLYLATIYAFLTLATRAETTAAPYFHVASSGDAAGETLPLKSSKATVAIDGTIARATLEQTYANNGDKPIEAISVGVLPGN